MHLVYVRRLHSFFSCVLLVWNWNLLFALTCTRRITLAFYFRTPLFFQINYLRFYCAMRPFTLFCITLLYLLGVLLMTENFSAIYHPIQAFLQSIWVGVWCVRGVCACKFFIAGHLGYFRVGAWWGRQMKMPFSLQQSCVAVVKRFIAGITQSQRILLAGL